jgi:hypothetical protein
MSGWRQIGDFNLRYPNNAPNGGIDKHAKRLLFSKFPTQKVSYSRLSRKVDYINFEKLNVVKRISVGYIEGQLKIYFYGSGHYDKELINIATIYNFKCIKHTVFIVLTDLPSDFQDKLFDFMNAVNKYKYTFSSEIIHEMKSLYHHIVTHYLGDNHCRKDEYDKVLDMTVERYSGPAFVHTLPRNTGGINDERVGPAPLVQILVKLPFNILSHEEAEKEVKWLLKRGSDVNQCDAYGTSALKQAIICADFSMSFYRVMFKYGGDVFAELDADPCLYLLLSSNKYDISHREEKLQCTINWLSRLRKSPISIINVEMSRRYNQIYTKFIIKQNKGQIDQIETCFKPTEELNDEEKRELSGAMVSVFCKKDDHDDKEIKKEADEEIREKENFVEIVRRVGNPKIKGLVLSRMKIMDDKRQCQLYSSVTYIDPDIPGLARLLTLRTVHCLEQLRWGYHVSALYVSISDKSFNFLDGLECYPMYQPDWLDDNEVRRMLKRYYPDDTWDVVRDPENPLVWYLLNQWMVRNLIIDPDDHFFREVLNCKTLPSLKDTDGRGALKYLCPYIESAMTLARCFLTFNLFVQYLADFTTQLAEMRNEKFTGKVKFRHHNHSFWSGPIKVAEKQSKKSGELVARL